MKKILAMMLAVVIGMAGVTAYAADKSDAKQQKEWRKNAEKLAKKQLKTIKKEKWLTNSTSPIEEALVRYYMATDPGCGGKGRGVAYDVNNAKSLSLGERRALTMAQNTYVQETQAMIIGEIAEHAASRNEDGDEVMISDVKTKIKDELQGDVLRAFTLYKENKDKTFWVRTYFIIDSESSAVKLKNLSKRVASDEEMARAIKKAADGIQE